jgi:peptidoglycan/LPS O-acetylase OafA/YrhL
MISLSDRLDATRGRPAGFDYMRVSLASLVVLFHAFACYGPATFAAVEGGPLRPLWAMILPMFFGLSGFLVSGSLERSPTLVQFLGLRVIRLVPALAVEAVLSLLIIGTLFTTLPLHDFFRNRETWQYLLNIVGDVHFYLPGVFDGNPFSAQVNGQLWSLPVELKCYLVISILATLGAYRFKRLLIASCIALQLYCSYRMMFVFISPNDVKGLLGASALVLAFIYGVALYRLRDDVPWDFRIFAGCLAIGFLLLRINYWNSFAVLPLTYCTVYLGLADPPRSRIISSGDYSYGIYLYSGPIQQAVIAAFPAYRTWWLNLLISVPLVALAAAGSWHLIEKRALKLRPALKALERHWMPVSDQIFAFCLGMMPPGLKARWMRDRSAA